MDINKIASIDVFKNWLIDNIYNFTRLKDMDGNDCYLLSAKLGKLDILKFIEKKLSWNRKSKNREGNNAFLVAIKNNQKEIVKYLSSSQPHYFNANNKNNRKNSPYIVALKSGCVEMIEYIESIHTPYIGIITSGNYNIFMNAIKSCSLDVIKYIYNKKTWTKEELLQRNHNGEDAFLLSVRCGNVEIMRYVLKKYRSVFGKLKTHEYKVCESSVNRANGRKKPHPRRTSINPDQKICNGVSNNQKWSIYIRKHNLNDAYLLAACYGKLDILKCLDTELKWKIYDKCNDYKINKNGHNAYLAAAANGHVEVMKYLEQTHDWDIHTKLSYSRYGLDAYIIAKRRGKNNVTNYLVNTHGWDTSLGRSYHYAIGGYQ